jgi:hypothetical protein
MITICVIIRVKFGEHDKSWKLAFRCTEIERELCGMNSPGKFQKRDLNCSSTRSGRKNSSNNIKQQSGKVAVGIGNTTATTSRSSLGKLL